MICELEGIHSWHNGEIVLNDLRSGFPRYRVRDIGGLIQTADFDAIADFAIGRLGEVPRRGDREGKTVTYVGDIEALTLASLAQARAAFIAAFTRTDERKMEALVHPDYSGGDLEDRFYYARPLDAAAESSQGSPHNASHGYKRAFSLSLRLSDPRYYDTTAISVQDATQSTMGGAGVPFTPGSSSAGPSAEGYEIITNNPGNVDTPAIFKMHGPLINPVLSNQTLGVFLRFKALEIADGHSVTVDWRRRRAFRTASGNNVRHTLDPASTWWNRDTPCLNPGSNTLRLRGYAVGAGAKLELDYNPADIA